MIAKKDILNALNLALVGLGGGLTVYRDKLPQEFDRPSYYIELGKRTASPATRWSVEVQQPVRILCIGELDDSGNADTDALEQMSDDVIAMLSIGFLRVGDRCLHIDQNVSDRPAEDGKEVIAALHYFDAIPGDVDTEPLITDADIGLHPKEG